jgi:DNA repair exonuclease SbcCD ATPase subunit
MNLDLFAYSIIALICTILLLGIVLVAVVISSRKSLKKRQELETEAESILNKAKQDALVIEKKEIYTQLQNLSEEEKSMYQQSLNQVTADIKNYLLTQFKSEVESLDKEMMQTLSAKLDGIVAKFQAEVEEYKKLRMSEIDKGASNVLSDFLTEATGRAIPLDVHQDLIIKALEEAKKKNVF